MADSAPRALGSHALPSGGSRPKFDKVALMACELGDKARWQRYDRHDVVDHEQIQLSASQHGHDLFKKAG